MKQVNLSDEQAKQLEKMLDEAEDRENQKLTSGQAADWGTVGLASYLRVELDR